jgi:hypothetical protein
MSQTSVTFTESAFCPSSIAENDSAAAGTTASSEATLQQLDLELAQKVSQMRQLADRLAARLESNLKLELLKLPKDVQKMSMRDFCVQYGGDVDEAMKQTKMKDVLPPPAMSSVNLAAGKGASAEAASASARGGRSTRGAPSNNATGRKRQAETPSGVGQTPGAGGRATRSKLQVAATPSGAAASKGLAMVSGTPANGRGPAAAAFTPRAHETPRAAQLGENGYSANGSPINLLNTVRARSGKPGPSSGAVAPSVVLTMLDGSEFDLEADSTLKALEADDEKKAQAVSELEKLKAKVDAHLKALAGPRVFEM